jgi:hypothetical protein
MYTSNYYISKRLLIKQLPLMSLKSLKDFTIVCLEQEGDHFEHLLKIILYLKPKSQFRQNNKIKVASLVVYLARMETHVQRNKILTVCLYIYLFFFSCSYNFQIYSFQILRHQ